MRVTKLIAALALSSSMLLSSGMAGAGEGADAAAAVALADADFAKGLEAAHSGEFKTAVAEWTTLAEQGAALAQAYLGVMYRKGTGVPENDETAVFWYTKAAEQGQAISQFALGEMYTNGEGVLIDYKRAYMWFNLSGVNRVSSSSSYIASIFGPTLAKLTEKMTPADIAKAQDMSRRCLESNYTDC